MIEELYINGMNVDIEDVDIVRTYRTPFFSDVEELKQDGSYTVTLPLTSQNKAVFEHCYREDFATDFPYKVQKAAYYVEGFTIFEDAEVRILSLEEDSIEVQFVYGISREKYLPLFTRKLNEIVPNGTTILESDWVVAWNKDDMFATGKKYKYLSYVSGERESEVKIIGGVEEPLTEAPEPFLSNLKEMTMHPFVAFTDILDLIIADHNANEDNTEMVSTELDSLKARIASKGLILSGDKDYKEYTYQNIFDGTEKHYSGLLIGYSEEQSLFFDVNSFGHPYFSFDKTIYNAKITLTIEITDNVGEISLKKGTSTTPSPDDETILTLTKTGSSGGKDTYDAVFYVDIEPEFKYYFSFENGGMGINYTVSGGGVFRCEYAASKSLFAQIEDGSYNWGYGRYNCLMNLPDMTAADFINQMLIMTGLFVGHDTSGNIKFLSLDNFKANLLAGAESINDWSGKVSQREKSYFQFNSAAQKNWIKFANSDDRTYTAKDSIVVDDTTLDTEKDLYSIKFDLAEQAASGMAEFILYKQKVASSEKDVSGTPIEIKTFSNEYSSKNDVCVYDDSGTAVNTNVLPQAFVTAYYGVYKDIVYRPRVLEIEVNLSMVESATIDFEKPIYIKEFGRYCMLLDLQAPNHELCVAKILLINQTL